MKNHLPTTQILIMNKEKYLTPQAGLGEVSQLIIQAASSCAQHSIINLIKKKNLPSLVHGHSPRGLGTKTLGGGVQIQWLGKKSLISKIKLWP
jgi:hypothetical protein